MDLETFLITTFVVCDDFLNALDLRLRQRGPAPELWDSEVLAMELAGEFLGYDSDKAIYRYFRTQHPTLFPALLHLHRTTFVRQAANLWAVKARLWKHLLLQIQANSALSIIDSFPLPLFSLRSGQALPHAHGASRVGLRCHQSPRLLGPARACADLLARDHQ